MRREKETTGIIETRTQREHNYEVAKCKSVERTTKQELKIESGVSGWVKNNARDNLKERMRKINRQIRNKSKNTW